MQGTFRRTSRLGRQGRNHGLDTSWNLLQPHDGTFSSVVFGPFSGCPPATNKGRKRTWKEDMQSSFFIFSFFLMMLLGGLPAPEQASDAATKAPVIDKGTDAASDASSRTASPPMSADKLQKLQALWDRFRGGQVIYDGRVGRKITFTFDDGPADRVTPRVLAWLERYKIRASFFVNGRRFGGRSSIAAKNREVLLATALKGHFLGNHTFTHPIMGKLDGRAQSFQILATERAILNVTGLRTYIYRPPFGGRTGYSQSLLKKRGYATVMWNLSGADAFDRHVAKVHRNVMRKIGKRQGGIILLHDTNGWSAEAVPLIVRSILIESCKLLYRGEEPFLVVGLEHFWVSASDKTPGPPSAALEEAASWRARTTRICGLVSAEGRPRSAR